MTDILFIKTSSLGDVIHHMPALTEARHHRPGARFAWVVEEAYAPLVHLHPAVDEVIPVATRRWRRALLDPSTWKEFGAFRARLRARRYDAVIDSQGLLRSALMARLARGPRHGYDARSIREPLASFCYDIRHSVGFDLHAIERNRRLTGLALGYVPSGPIDYGLDRPSPASSRYAVFLHATARAEKEWPEANWIALGQALADLGCRFVFPWGEARERERGERLALHLTDADVPARRPLDDVARMIAGASFVVGVDTGLLHLAAAFGVPLVAIFTGSDPGLTGPLGSGPMAILGTKGTSPAVEAVSAAVRQVLQAPR